MSFSGILATKCVSLNNEPCLDRPTLFDLNSNEFHYYPFRVSLDRCNESCNTVDDLSSRICVSNKAEDVNLNVFNVITRINESKTLTKYISSDFKCKFDGRKSNLNQKWNNSKCQCECNKPIKHGCKRDCVWKFSAFDCEIN